MVSDEEPETVYSGHVRYFNKERGYGFVAPNIKGKDIFFYIRALLKANRETINGGTHVTYTHGTDRDGRLQVGRFVKIGGQYVTEGKFDLIDKQFVLRRTEPQKIEIPVPVTKPVAVIKPAIQKPVVQEKIPPSRDEWITVTIGRMRPQHMAYAKSDALGQIKVPWEVLQNAKITDVRGKKFEVCCDVGEDLLVAHVIRKF